MKQKRPFRGEKARKYQGWFRCSKDDLQIIKEAAVLSGMTYSGFAYSAVMRAARQKLKEYFKGE